MDSDLLRARWTFRRIANIWARFWMSFAGLGAIGRLATRFAVMGAPPYEARKYLRDMNASGFISPQARIHHADLTLGPHVFIDDRALIFQSERGGTVELGERVSLYRDVIVHTGQGGSIRIGAGTGVQPRCQIEAFLAPIKIGYGVAMGSNCVLLSYDHGVAPHKEICEQPLQTKGSITIGDGAWLGTGVIVLSGVTIGKGAVIGAGAVVTHDIPDRAVAAGVPARVIKMRDEIGCHHTGVDSDKEN